MPRKQIHGPEWYIRRDFKLYLEAEGWHVEVFACNAFQHGIPDLYAFHKKWGERWIDLKNPKKYCYTRDQKAKWPVWESAGIGIWIIVAATADEYDKLFQPPNWRKYEKKKKTKTKADAAKMLEELEAEELRSRKPKAIKKATDRTTKRRRR
jgi:hypothetical protein